MLDAIDGPVVLVEFVLPFLHQLCATLQVGLKDLEHVTEALAQVVSVDGFEVRIDARFLFQAAAGQVPHLRGAVLHQTNVKR